MFQTGAPAVFVFIPAIENVPRFTVLIYGG
jgi:hypothetical protein